jgi:hypothetical protein
VLYIVVIGGLYPIIEDGAHLNLGAEFALESILAGEQDLPAFAAAGTSLYVVSLCYSARPISLLAIVPILFSIFVVVDTSIVAVWRSSQRRLILISSTRQKAKRDALHTKPHVIRISNNRR